MKAGADPPSNKLEQEKPLYRIIISVEQDEKPMAEYRAMVFDCGELWKSVRFFRAIVGFGATLKELLS